MSYETLKVEKKDGIATVSLNRPDRYNAMNTTLLSQLEAVFRSLEKDDEVRVIVVTGTLAEGKKPAFSSGADITEFLEYSQPAKSLELSLRGQEVFNYIESFPKPVIAKLGGFAFGGGCELAMSCDFIIASDNIELGQPEINLGMIPGWGGTQRLTRRVGISKALWIIQTGDRISAKEAQEWGLVDKVVPRSNLDATVDELARKLVAKSPIALRLAKKTIRQSRDADLKAGLLSEAEAVAICFSTEDFKEGVAAFREKRQPIFKGK